jgi:dephospho-CoA kinase
MLFSADKEVARLTSDDPEVRAEIRALLGPSSYTPEETYNRENVRRVIFQNPELRIALNAILHPRVRAAWGSLASEFRLRKDWLLAEVPLLFETGGETLCERVSVVACTRETQLLRLTKLRGLELIQAQQIIVAQSSLEEKSNKADHLIWNDCPFPCLARQAALCAACLLNHHS